MSGSTSYPELQKEVLRRMSELGRAIVAVMMGGGPSAVYGSMAMAAVDQFQAGK